MVQTGFIPQSVQLNASAAFQLLVAANNESVRVAAAEALWPRELIQASDLECNDVPFESLPYHERALALLVASMIDENPSHATRLRVEPLYEFLAPRSDSHELGRRRIFRMKGGITGPTVQTPVGSKYRWSRTAAFTVPSSAHATVMQVCSWSMRERKRYRDQYRWSVGRTTAYLDLRTRVSQRALATGLRPMLVSACGDRVYEVCQGSYNLVAKGRLELDSPLILRLAAGGLAGSVLSFSNRMPNVSGRRPRDVTLSLEIGPSLDEPLIASSFKGNFEPRYRLEGILPSRRVQVRLVGGATIDELHVIAREVGVWHGDRLRGSFAYHPLRTKAKSASSSQSVSAEVA